MSYILDALRKSERERQQGTVPDVLTLQEDRLQPVRRRSLWPVITAAVLLLNGLFLLWWFAPWKAGDRKAVVAEPVARTEPSGIITPAASPAGSEGDPEPLHAREDANRSTGPDNKAVTGTAIAPQTKVLTSRLPDRQKEAAEPKEAAEKTKEADSMNELQPSQVSAAMIPPPENRVYRLRELPEQLRRTLPGFSISAFLYSATPASRMVRINGMMLREGEELSPGLKLEEITPEGVIMSSRAYRFSIEVR